MAMFDFTKKEDKKIVVPLLPLRDVVVFPYMIVPLFVGREKSINALESAMKQENEIFLVAQKSAQKDEPTEEDIYEIGTLGVIIQLLRLPDGTVKALVEGKKRATARKYIPNPEHFVVEIEEVAETSSESTGSSHAVARVLVEAFKNYAKLSRKIQPELVDTIAAIDNPAKLSDVIASHLGVKLEKKQALLEITDAGERLEKLYSLIIGEIEILELEEKIKRRVKKQMEKTQKDYYLNEQMRAIQKEMGDKDDFSSEIEELEKRLKGKKLSEEAQKKVKHEIKKLKMMSPMSAEATVVRNYIDWLLDMPWHGQNGQQAHHEGVRGHPRRGSLRAQEGQGADPRVSGRAVAREEEQGLHPLPGGTSRRRQDLHRQVDRPGDEPQVRAALAWRPAGRGGDPWASPDLHRGAARQDHPAHQEGGVQQSRAVPRRDRQAQLRLPGRSQFGPARSPRSGAERRLQRQLPGSGLRPVRRDVHHDGQHPADHPGAAPGPHGGHPDRRVHGAGETQHCEAVSREERNRGQWSDGQEHPVHRRGDPGHDPEVHARGRRPEPGARNRLRLPEGRSGDRDHGHKKQIRINVEVHREIPRHPQSSASASPRGRIPSDSPRVWRGPRWEASC